MQESQGAGQAFHLGGACAIFTHPHLVQDNLAIGKARSLSFREGTNRKRPKEGQQTFLNNNEIWIPVMPSFNCAKCEFT